MGEPKQLMELEGKPMLQWVRDLALAFVDQVIVVTGYESEKVAALAAHPRVSIVHNDLYEKGQGTSLQAGLLGLPADCQGAVVLLGDQPFLPPAVLRRILHQGRRHRMDFPKKAFAVRPVYRGTPAHPVYFGHPHRLPEPPEKDRGGQAMMQELPVVEYEVKEALVTFDIDTPAQWKKAGELASHYDFSYNFRNTGGGSLAGTVNS